MTDDETAALVTGGAQGIGKAIAERFAEDDSYETVALLDIDDAVQDVAASLDGGVGLRSMSATTTPSGTPFGTSRGTQTSKPQ